MDVFAELRADDELVLNGLRSRAERDGDRCVISDEQRGTRLSYGELDSLVRRVANSWRRFGLTPGDRVAVLTRTPVTAAIAMFAAWRGGMVFSPVNFNLNAETLAYQLADADVAAVVCQDRLLPLLADASPALRRNCVVAVEGSQEQLPVALKARRVVAWAESADGPDTEPQVSREPADPANIIYTSGTTGRPKGVVQPYRWMNQYTFFPRRMLTPDDVVYNDLPLYHVGGAIYNVARAVWAGASLAVWDKFSSTDFWRRIRQSNATTAVLLDVMIPWLMNAPESPTDGVNPLNKVHLQPLPLYHNEFATRFGIEWVTAGFGQTETGLTYFGLIDELGVSPREHACGFDRRQMLDLFSAFGLPVVSGTKQLAKGFLGGPSPFFETTVLDETDEQLGDDVRGELAVRPRMPHLLMREYFGRPEATARTLRNQWFHTGDVAYRGPDGFGYWVDRHGDRIRVRGENVSSAQVEDLLNRMPGVGVSAVFGVPSAEGLEHDIAAFVVAQPEADVNEAEVSVWAAAEIPRFMRPRHIRVVAELPRTATNKIEKFKLRAALLRELGDAAGQSERSAR